jgi:hypothetical protein
MWFSCSSIYCTCLTRFVICTLSRSVLERIAKPSHAEERVLSDVLGYLNMMLMKLVRVFLTS